MHLEKMFEEAVNRVSSDKETIEFVNYLIGNYANYVFSHGLIVSLYILESIQTCTLTYYITERMHRTLNKYLQGKIVKRLNKLFE